MGQVIAVDFRRSVPPPHDFELVRRLGRQAAAVLTRHAGRAKLSVDVDSVSVTAEVVGQFALSLLASSFCPRRPAGTSLREWLTTPQQRQLGLELHADVEWLIDQSLATSGSFGRECAVLSFSSVESVADWLRSNCLRVPVERVSAGVISGWSMQRVHVPDEAGSQFVEVTLVDAVKRYGARYGARISIDLLEQEQGLSRVDATVINGAVRRILPKGKKA
jgi:hypothetical protein